MKQTVYLVPKMDCPTEEQIIRNRLKSIEEIEQLDFDLVGREFTVTHHLDDSRSLFVLPTLYDWFERDEATGAPISKPPSPFALASGT